MLNSGILLSSFVTLIKRGWENNFFSNQNINFKNLNGFIEKYRYPNIPSCGGCDLVYDQLHNAEKKKDKNKKKKYLSPPYKNDDQKYPGSIKNDPPGNLKKV